MYKLNTSRQTGPLWPITSILLPGTVDSNYKTVFDCIAYQVECKKSKSKGIVTIPRMPLMTSPMKGISRADWEVVGSVSFLLESLCVTRAS